MKTYPGNILRQHRTDRKLMGLLRGGNQHRTDRKLVGLLREQCAELKKGHLQCCCNQVWMKNGGRIPWNAVVVCETYKISCLMERHPMRDGSEYHLKTQVFRLERW